MARLDGEVLHHSGHVHNHLLKLAVSLFCQLLVLFLPLEEEGGKLLKISLCGGCHGSKRGLKGGCSWQGCGSGEERLTRLW